MIVIDSVVHDFCGSAELHYDEDALDIPDFDRIEESRKEQEIIWEVEAEAEAGNLKQLRNVLVLEGFLTRKPITFPDNSVRIQFTTDGNNFFVADVDDPKVCKFIQENLSPEDRFIVKGRLFSATINKDSYDSEMTFPVIQADHVCKVRRVEEGSDHAGC